MADVPLWLIGGIVVGLLVRGLLNLMARFDNRPTCVECGRRESNAMRITWSYTGPAAKWSLNSDWWVCHRHSDKGQERIGKLDAVAAQLVAEQREAAGGR